MSDGKTARSLAFDDVRARDRLLSALRLDLLGPETAEEVLTQSPGSRYLVGMLAPRGTSVDPSEDEGLDTEDESDGSGEDAVRLSASLDPSSIGLSCVIDASGGELAINVSWGEYTKHERSETVDAELAGAVERDADPDSTAKRPQKQYEWRRSEKSASLTIAPTETASHIELVGEDVGVEWLVRKLGPDLVASIFLVNQRLAPAGKRPPDEDWIYQPRIEVASQQGSILPRHRVSELVDPDPDIASNDLIYRARREFATGHGAATNWTLTNDRKCATAAWTDLVPAREVPIVTPRGTPGAERFDMTEFATAAVGDLRTTIEPLLSSYSAWIDEHESEIAALSPANAAVAKDHVSLARVSLKRMASGLELLCENQQALAAFRFANKAMAAQRLRTEHVLARRRGETPPSEVPTEWRPFQLGFMLVCLAGIADPRHDDRAIADLLWFPTGGGKTEAYLGLTAFTLAYRRLTPNLQYDTSSGTSVLMRYTLRLLTIQQFNRALTLLCACEQIRIENEDDWGLGRFTIGLWVGQQATPNSYADSKQALEDLQNSTTVYDRSPYQVLYCPWCGEDLEPGDYVADDELERTLIKCSNHACDFNPSRSELGLPVLLVDDEIYRHPPSLLLATVDKFAQMAWKGRIQALFGRVTRSCPRHGFITAGDSHPDSHNATPGYPKVTVSAVELPLAPPDLIIQDELHLISGPLGTLVGIYETAIDALCTRVDNGTPVRPKVIASTATIRRANRQVEALFNRQVKVFPPLGLTAEDNYFAVEADPDVAPGRLYVGVYAPGKSVKTALVRVYAAMLSRAEYEYSEAPGPDTDSYMTLVGYFNSLRELGGALRLVEDDVPARLRVLERRGFGPRRLIYETEELTSRKRGFEIPSVLQKLDRTFGEKVSGSYPVDVLLASNMISVGVDISRLGLMVMSGQPKTTAEYIQATSRVGRLHPGLVIDVYNWSRPRDTSHYERFRHYHETFYRHVEATSVTPFSARARDRALAGVLTSFVRLDEPGMASEQGADNLDADGDAVKRIVDAVVQRVRDVTSREDVAAETEQQLRNLVATWAHWADEDLDLVYTVRGTRDPTAAVLIKPIEQLGGRGIWPVATSLREVENEVPVVLTDQQDES